MDLRQNLVRRNKRRFQGFFLLFLSELGGPPCLPVGRNIGFSTYPMCHDMLTRDVQGVSMLGSGCCRGLSTCADCNSRPSIPHY